MGVVLLLIALIFFSTYFILLTYFNINQNEATVVTRFGHLEYVADPGLHFKIPFANSTESDRTDIPEIHLEKGVNTYTIDNQEVGVIFTVSYRLPRDKVEDLYRNSRDYCARLYSLTIDGLRAAMGQVDVQSVAEQRGELHDAIKTTLSRDAVPLGVEITNFQLTDTRTRTPSGKRSIMRRFRRPISRRSEYQRQQAQKQAEMTKITAEGQANAERANAADAADVRLLQAQAEAKAIELQGEAQAAAVRAQADALKANPDVVNLRKAERWDGKLPTALYANAPIPFLPVDKVEKEKVDR